MTDISKGLWICHCCGHSQSSIEKIVADATNALAAERDALRVALGYMMACHREPHDKECEDAWGKSLAALNYPPHP